MSYMTEETGKPGSRAEGFKRTLVQSVTMIAPKCPDHAGLVEGKYLIETNVTATPAGGGEVTTTHYVADAVMRGQVGEDAALQWIDANVMINRTGGGMPPGIAHYAERLTPLGRGYSSGAPQMTNLFTSDGDMILNFSIVSTMVRSQGLLAFDAAEREWRSPNTCVMLMLDPPTRSQEMEAGDTLDIKAQLLAIADNGSQEPDRSLFKAQPTEGARIDPTETLFAVTNGKQTFSFTAGSPKAGGFKLRATSVSGIAETDWRAIGQPRYRLEFTASSDMSARRMGGVDNWVIHEDARGATDLDSIPTNYPGAPPVLKEAAGALAHSHFSGNGGCTMSRPDASQPLEVVGTYVWDEDAGRLAEPRRIEFLVQPKVYSATGAPVASGLVEPVGTMTCGGRARGPYSHDIWAYKTPGDPLHDHQVVFDAENPQPVSWRWTDPAGVIREATFRLIRLPDESAR